MKWMALIKLGAMAAILATMLALPTGCGEGMAITRRERQEQHHRIFENDMKQISDDLDLIMLNDDVGRMSKWRIR